MKLKSEREVAQSCPTLRDLMDCSLPGSSVHGIFPGKSTGVGCHCLGSRNSTGGLAHSAGERRALSQTWRESHMREGGGRKGLASKDQSLSCHLLIWLKSFSVGND